MLFPFIYIYTSGVCTPSSQTPDRLPYIITVYYLSTDILIYYPSTRRQSVISYYHVTAIIRDDISPDI